MGWGSVGAITLPLSAAYSVAAAPVQDALHCEGLRTSSPCLYTTVPVLHEQGRSPACALTCDGVAAHSWRRGPDWERHQAGVESPWRIKPAGCHSSRVTALWVSFTGPQPQPHGRRQRAGESRECAGDNWGVFKLFRSCWSVLSVARIDQPSSTII